MNSDNHQQTSPFTLVIILGVLVISTLVLISHFFLAPKIENDLRNQISERLTKEMNGNVFFNISGRDVNVKALVADKTEADKFKSIISSVEGIRDFNFDFMIKNQSSE